MKVLPDRLAEVAGKKQSWGFALSFSTQVRWREPGAPVPYPGPGFDGRRGSEIPGFPVRWVGL
jgi:hypothetical protein